MLTKIDTRAKIKVMVTSFYTQVQEDELLSAIFNHHLSSDELWEDHFEKLTDFWESALHGKRVYSGAPAPIHNMVDLVANYEIDQMHFDRWLEMWRANIHNQFEGEVADRAISLAENLAVNFLRNMKRAKR